MAGNEQYFDRFSNLKALESEQRKVLGLLNGISEAMKTLQQQGIRISFGGSIKEINQVIKELEATNKTLAGLRKEYVVSSSKIIQSKQAETRATKDLTKANADEIVAARERKKDMLLEAQLRRATANSIEEYSVKIAILERNLRKLDLAKESDLIIQDSINKQIAEYNRLIDSQKPGGAPKVQGNNTPVTPAQDIPFSHNLDDLEKQKDLLEKTGEVVNDLDREQVDAALSAEQWAASQRGVSDAIKSTDIKAHVDGTIKYKDELEKLTGTLGENEMLLGDYKKELTATQQEIKELEAKTAASGKATKTQQLRLEELRRTESNLKKEIKELTYVTKQQTIENSAAAGSLEKLQARYNLLILQISKLNKVQRESSLGKGLIAEAKSLDVQIAQVQKKTGQISSAANGMSNALSRSLGRFIGYLRNIAYLIPGIGIGGLIGLIIEPIINLFDTADKEAEELNSKLKDLIKTSEEVREVGEFSNEGDIALINSLSAAVLDQTKSYKERNNALNQLKEINKTYFGDLTLEKAQLGLLTTAVEEYTDALIAQSVVKAFGDQIGQVSVEFAKQTSTLNKANAEAQKYKNQIDAITEPYEKMVRSSARFNEETGDVAGFRSMRDAIHDIMTQVDDPNLSKLLKLERSFDKNQHTAYLAGGAFLELAHNLKELKDNFKLAVDESLKFKPLTTPKGDGDDAAKRIKNYDKVLKSLRDSYLQIANDENIFFIERKKAKEEATSIEVLLIEQKRKIDVANAKGNAYDILNINKEADQELIDLKIDTTKFLEKLDLDYQNKLLESARKGKDVAAEFPKSINDQLVAMYNEKAAIAQDANDLELSDIKNAYEKQQGELEKKYAKGKISKRKFESEQLKIQQEFEIKALESTIENARKQLAVERQLANLEQDPTKKANRLRDIETAESKLNGMLIALANLRFKNTKEINKKTYDDFLKMFEGIANAAKETFEIIGGFIHARSEKEKNAIQEQIDLLEEKRQKDLEGVDQTITNERDKADAIIRINALADAQKTALQTKQRQAQERDARFQKASTIASIISETALAVVRALGAKPYTPANIALAAITGALGAAQLAVAIATPIPKYAKGGTLEKTKTIQLAEEGRELAVSPSGELTLYEKPTITTLAGGTQILSNKVTEDMLKSNKGVRPITTSSNTSSVQIDRTGEVLTELKAIKKRVRLVVINTMPIETTPYYLENLKGK